LTGSDGSSPQYLGGACSMVGVVEWTYNGGSRSRAPGYGSKPPWSWSTFGFWTFNGSHKLAHFSKIWKRKEIRYLC